jgi:hypothetical protein
MKNQSKSAKQKKMIPTANQFIELKNSLTPIHINDRRGSQSI